MKYILYFGVVTALLAFSHADNTVTPNPLCPYPSDDFTRFPYQGNCTKYWECYQGQRYPMSCPDGLEYNAEESVCDFPETANCDSDATVTYPTFTTPASTTPGTGPTTPHTTAWTPDPLCPYPSDELIYVAYPTNCSLYYECYQGIKYLMACPAGLVFNLEAGYCDFPDNVDCNRTSTTIETTTVKTTTPLTTTTSTPIESTTSGSTTTPGCTSTPGSTTNPGSTTTKGTTMEPVNICTNQPDGTFLSDPDDCSKFYECLHGKVLEGSCPLDLLWNEAKLTCDYPENVICAT